MGYAQVKGLQGRIDFRLFSDVCIYIYIYRVRSRRYAGSESFRTVLRHCTRKRKSITASPTNLSCLRVGLGMFVRKAERKASLQQKRTLSASLRCSKICGSGRPPTS